MSNFATAFSRPICRTPWRSRALPGDSRLAAPPGEIGGAFEAVPHAQMAPEHPSIGPATGRLLQKLSTVPRDPFLCEGYRWFESMSLQRGVRCELTSGTNPIDEVGNFTNASAALMDAAAGGTSRRLRARGYRFVAPVSVAQAPAAAALLDFPERWEPRSPWHDERVRRAARGSACRPDNGGDTVHPRGA